jgi:hypothetical protein
MPTINVIALLALIAFVMVLLSAIGKTPLWIAVFLLALIELSLSGYDEYKLRSGKLSRKISRELVENVSSPRIRQLQNTLNPTIADERRTKRYYYLE